MYNLRPSTRPSLSNQENETNNSMPGVQTRLMRQLAANSVRTPNSYRSSSSASVQSSDERVAVFAPQPRRVASPELILSEYVYYLYQSLMHT